MAVKYPCSSGLQALWTRTEITFQRKILPWRWKKDLSAKSWYLNTSPYDVATHNKNIDKYSSLPLCHDNTVCPFFFFFNFLSGFLPPCKKKNLWKELYPAAKNWSPQENNVTYTPSVYCLFNARLMMMGVNDNSVFRRKRHLVRWSLL